MSAGDRGQEPDLRVERATLDAVLELREDYRRAMGCQIVHDSWHARGFTDLFLCRVDGLAVGYGAVGGAPGEPRDTVKEFHVLAPARPHARALFERLLAASGAAAVEVQTNDERLLLLALDHASGWRSDTLLFEDASETALPAPRGVRFRPVTEDDRARMFVHAQEPVGEFGLERAGRIVATGGVLSHYNPPYGDLYMEVDAAHRGQGLGGYLVQELKRVCRDRGLVPAARCRAGNEASRRTLERAGMLPCARILRGEIGRSLRPDREGAGADARPAPAASRRLFEIVLVVADVAAAAAFYRDAVGLEPIKAANDEWASFWLDDPATNAWLGLRKGPLLFEEHSRLPAGRRFGPVHFALRVPASEKDAALARLRGHGIEVHGPQRWGPGRFEGASYYFHDPDQNLVEYWFPGTPGGETPSPRGEQG